MPIICRKVSSFDLDLAKFVSGLSTCLAGLKKVVKYFEGNPWDEGPMHYKQNVALKHILSITSTQGSKLFLFFRMGALSPFWLALLSSAKYEPLPCRPHTLQAAY